MVDVSAESLNVASAGRTPISGMLEQLKRDVPKGRVTLGWLFEYLRARSPEVPILILALIGVLPGVSLPIGILLALLSLAMMTARPHNALPQFLASQPLTSTHIVRAIEKSVPVFQWGERHSRPRDAQMTNLL